jgi:hypothetical protein
MYTKCGHEPPVLAALHSTHSGTSNSTNIHIPTPSPPPHSPTSPSLLPPTPNETSPSTYSYLKALRRDFNNRILSAIALMRELRDYTQECLHKQEEWSVDRRAETRQNHNITYLKCNYIARPQSWDEVDEPEDGLPRIIEGLHPLCPRLKWHRYRNGHATNSCVTYYHTSQLWLPLKPEDNDIAPANPPHPSTLRIGHQSNNNTDKPTHHINSGTTFYTTFPSRPPPWPNKCPNQDQNQHQHNSRYTLARNTMGQQPPPRPKIPTTPSLILSIANPRPPPWPIIPRHLDQTLQNH